MLSCMVGNTNVNVVDYEEKQLRQWSNKKILKCPVCGERLIYKKGLVRVAHFSHEKDSECTYTFYENETKFHALGKVLLYKWLKQLDRISNLELESYVKETKQRPDLYFELNDKRYVIEYQCTPITLEEYLERKELYKLNGIIDIWILGTDNFNFKPSGKIKIKILDGVLFSEKKLYYFNPFEEMIYKVYSSFEYIDGFYNLKKQHISDNNNFYIENDEIILNETLHADFLFMLEKYLKNIQDNENKEFEQLLSEQREIYNKIMLEIEEEKQIQFNNKIKELIKDKIIYLYDSYEKLISTKQTHKFNYVTYRGNMITKNWLLNELYNTNIKDFSKNEIHILMSKWDFSRKNIRDFLINCFPTNEVIFVKGVEIR